MTFAQAVKKARYEDRDIYQLGWNPELSLTWIDKAIQFEVGLALRVVGEASMLLPYYITAADLTAEWEVR